MTLNATTSLTKIIVHMIWSVISGCLLVQNHHRIVIPRDISQPACSLVAATLRFPKQAGGPKGPFPQVSQENISLGEWKSNSAYG